MLRHRKLIELARDLRIKPVYALGHLHALWHAALEQQEDGDLSSWSDELVAQLSGYDGDALQYVSLLQLHGWLDGKLLHDWLDYAGNYLSRKYHNSDRRKLQTMWLKYDRRYGKSTSSRKKKGYPDTSPVISSPPGSSKGESLRGEIPDGIEPEAWEEYLSHRKRKRAPLTPKVKERLVKKLVYLKDIGHDPNEVLRMAIDRNWTGLEVDWVENNAQVNRPKREPSDRIKRVLLRGL